MCAFRAWTLDSRKVLSELSPDWVEIRLHQIGRWFISFFFASFIHSAS